MFLISRIRSKDKTLRVYARCSANPGGPGHAWLKARFVEPTDRGARTFVDPYGLTRQFIPAKVRDNQILLDANPLYLAQLSSLPETLRKQLMDGDWDSGTGLALEELGEKTHLVDAFDIPPTWYRFAGFDWGFDHPWWFIGGAQDNEGNVYITHVVKSRRDLPDAIAARIKDVSDGTSWHVVAAGLDVFHEKRARGEYGPTIAERLQLAGLPIVRATISRVSGLNNLRWYLAKKGRPQPKLRFFDTAPCRMLVNHLRGIVLDPDRPEDSLKTNADRDTGEGGDDGYDTLRYMMMLRPYLNLDKPAPVGPIIGNVTNDQDPLVIPSVSDDWSRNTGGQFLGDI
jgi:hypothetical protein